MTTWLVVGILVLVLAAIFAAFRYGASGAKAKVERDALEDVLGDVAKGKKVREDVGDLDDAAVRDELRKQWK